MGQVGNKIDPNLVSENIKSGVSIYGVDGNVVEGASINNSNSTMSWPMANIVGTNFTLKVQYYNIPGTKIYILGLGHQLYPIGDIDATTNKTTANKLAEGLGGTLKSAVYMNLRNASYSSSRMVDYVTSSGSISNFNIDRSYGENYSILRAIELN